MKRRDYGLNLAFEAALLPFAWHPAARVLRRRLGETREMACDELASESLLGPRRYARSLVDVASGILRTAPSPALGVDDAGILEDRIRHLLRPHGTSPARRRLGIAAGVALLLATSLFASFAVVEAKPLPAAPAEWRSQMKNVVGAMMLALALPASGDDLTKGLEALKAGDLVVAAASVERAVAANPRDRDALYTLGVIRWQDAYNVLGAAKKAGTLDAERDRLKKTVTLGHDALRKAVCDRSQPLGCPRLREPPLPSRRRARDRPGRGPDTPRQGGRDPRKGEADEGVRRHLDGAESRRADAASPSAAEEGPGSSSSSPAACPLRRPAIGG